jgi:hypothetical protein
MARAAGAAPGCATAHGTGRPRLQLRHVVVACVILLVLGGCGPAVPSGSRIVAFEDEGLRLALPPGWEEIRSSEVGSEVGRTLFYLANQPLQQDCAGDGCAPPLDALLDGGVLVWWSSVRCAGVGCELPGGERLLIGGREAARGSDTGVCDAIGATEEKVYAVSVTPQRLDWIVICARSPTDDANAELASILDGIGWRTP